MLRHGCGYALANAGHDTRALHLIVQSSPYTATLLPTKFTVLSHFSLMEERSRSNRSSDGQQGQCGSGMAKVIGLLTAILIAGSAMGEGLPGGNARDAFIASAVKACFKTQRAATENVGLPLENIVVYCTCVANGSADVMTTDDVEGGERLDRVYSLQEFDHVLV
jgi:hypothetical protein